MSAAKLQGSNEQDSVGTRSVLAGGTRWVLQRYALVVVFAAIVVFFSLLKPDTFATSQNASTIASTLSPPVLTCTPRRMRHLRSDSDPSHS